MASRLCSQSRPTCPPPPLLQLQLPLPHSAQPDSPGAEAVTQRALEQGGEAAGSLREEEREEDPGAKWLLWAGHGSDCGGNPLKSRAWGSR